MNEPVRYRIGQIAEHLGVSTRTLRYYEELGLLTPSGYSTGGSRRYDEADRARIIRIRELQAVMGFNLDEIKEILGSEDRLGQLKSEVHKGVTPNRHQAIVAEAMRLNAQMQEQVRNKIAVLETFEAELKDKEVRYRARAAELGVDVAAKATAPRAR
ncbi:MAG: MerR family transcriptional regulator, repressor of the yfmOP operon [Actinomycetota bacterium]